MEFAHAVLVASGCAIVVGFTTFPVLTVIAILRGTKRLSRGLWFDAAYAAGLAVVFFLASSGVDKLRAPSWMKPGAWFEIIAGALLLAAAGFRLIRAARRQGRSAVARHRFAKWLSGVGPVTCAAVGFQFALHPENLVLTITAAGHTGGLGHVETTIVGVWFCALGVVTVFIPTLMFARSENTAGSSGHDRLKELEGWITAHGSALTTILLAVAGVILLGYGIWHFAA